MHYKNKLCICFCKKKNKIVANIMLTLRVYYTNIKIGYNTIANYFTWCMQLKFLLSIYFYWHVIFVNCYEKNTNRWCTRNLLKSCPWTPSRSSASPFFLSTSLRLITNVFPFSSNETTNTTVLSTSTFFVIYVKDNVLKIFEQY